MRVWIVSALLVAAVVAGVLYATRGGDAPRNAPRPRPPLPAPLTENEVRGYLAVTPEVDAQNKRNAAEFVRIWEQTGKYPDDPGHAMRARASIEAILQKHGHTPETYDLLQRRVEYVVNVLRWERDTPERTADMDRKIAEKEGLLGSLSGETRAQVQREVDQLKAQRDAPQPAVHDRDRELVTRYWEHLDRIAPRIGPAPSDAQR